MAEIVNLRRARKAKQRDAREQTAEANRRRFGRTAAEKEAEVVQRERAEKSLDAHKRDRD